ncbi:MAG: M23 family metallopeptidase, partial [Bacteroidota bacterium]
SRLLKETGDRIKKGDILAIIGNTGKLSSGPHLHFELWHQGQALNPEEIIAF